MKVTFIGTSGCIPDIGSEVASFLIGKKILVDTGWCSVLKMRKYGFDPLDLEYIILTHFHQDHYIGLPQLFSYLGLKKLWNKRSSSKPLHIIGPSKYLKKIVNKALEFLQISRFPELSLSINLIPLSPGKSWKGKGFRLDTFPARHISGKNVSEEALVCKFTPTYPNDGPHRDLRHPRGTGKSFSFTGDTHFHPPIAGFVKNTPLLIHDASHSSPKEAATIAKMANVRNLYLIHFPAEKGKHILAGARKIFSRSFLAKEGKSILL